MAYDSRTRAISTSMEITLNAKVTGTYVPAERETPPSYASGGSPGSPEDVEDFAVASLTGQTRVAGGWRETDLLAGVDTKSPEVQRLLSNLADFMAEDARGTLLDEVMEDAR